MEESRNARFLAVLPKEEFVRSLVAPPDGHHQMANMQSATGTALVIPGNPKTKNAENPGETGHSAFDDDVESGRGWTRNNPEIAGEYAKSSSRAAYALQSGQVDPRLRAIIEAWPTLPEGLKSDLYRSTAKSD